MSSEKPSLSFNEAVRLAAGVHAYVPRPNPADKIGNAMRACREADQVKGAGLRRAFMARLGLLADTDEP